MASAQPPRAPWPKLVICAAANNLRPGRDAARTPGQLVGTLIYTRQLLTAAAPQDIHAHARCNPKFPMTRPPTSSSPTRPSSPTAPSAALPPTTRSRCRLADRLCRPGVRTQWICCIRNGHTRNRPVAEAPLRCGDGRRSCLCHDACRPVPGSVGDFLSLVLGGTATGALVSAWSSMIAAAVHRQQGQGRRDAFFSAELERWAGEGLAIGSMVGLALAVLDAWAIV